MPLCSRGALPGTRFTPPPGEQPDLPLFQACYISRNLVAGAIRPSRELARLLRTCRRNNPALGITGVLVAGPQHFAQLLEGSREAVETLLAGIRADSRHADLAILASGHQTARAFPFWDMALIPTEGDGRFADLRLPSHPATAVTEQGRAAVAMLEYLTRCN